MKRFVARSLVFVLLLTLLQVLVSAAFPAEIPQQVLLLEEYLSSQVDIIYLGDSTLSYPVGEVTTGELLQELLPGYSIGEISHPAYNLDLYSYYVKNILRSSHPPRVVIIPINMRSFSPEWDMRPGYQFEEVKKTLTLGPVLSRMLSRPLEIFGLFEPAISQDTFLNTDVYNGDTLVGKVKDFEGLVDDGAVAKLQGDTGFAYHDALPSAGDTEALQQALIYRYMYGLEPDQRQLRAMLKIVELSDKDDVDVLFYITPINYQQGQRYLGDAFVKSLRDKTALVKSLLADSTGSTSLDLSFDLEAYAFVDMEHLREAGKEYLAGQLASALQSKRSVASSSNDGKATPAVRTPGLATSTPAATSTSTRPPPFPTVARPAPTTVATQVPVSPTVAGTALTPTPVLSSSVENDISGGAIVEAEYLFRSWPGGKYPVDTYRLRYETLDENDQITEMRADLFVPYVEANTSFPILVHAAGTTGIGSGCAPLDEWAKERDWGNYRGHSLTYASRGYIVILPNGLGFDEPDRIHPYFIAELQARVLLDAARAVRSLANNSLTDDMLAQPTDAVLFMGYSSGGHAVFAVKDWAASYAPEVPIKGIVGFGPTACIETLLREDPIFSPYLVYAYRDFYGNEIIDVDDVFLPRWRATFESDVLDRCVDNIFYYYSRSAREMYTPEFRAALYGDGLEEAHPLFAEKLSLNHAGASNGSGIPVLILQGTGDTVVTPESQEAFRDQLCEQGTPVTYLEYPAVPHTEIRWTSFGDALSWMQRVVRGDIPATDCEIGLLIE
jgi:dienelactone hydrolase